MPAGSASCLTSHINSVASAPHSRSTNGAMLSPVPCSAFSEPSYLSTISSTSSCDERVVALVLGLPCRSSAVRMKCRLPAEAWPARPGRKPCLPSSACRSLAASATRAGGTQTSSMIIVHPGRAHRGQQSLHALAHAPQHLDLLGVAGRTAARRPPRDRLATAGARRSRPRLLQRLELLRGLGAELDQQRRRGRRELLPRLGRAGHVVGGRDQRRRDHQLGGGRARRDQLADGVGGGVEVLEADQGQRRVAPERHGVEHRLGHEGQRPLGADDQAPEDLQRRVGVQERAQPIAGGVLDLELAGHALRQLGVGAELVADLRQARGQLRRGGGEPLLGVGRGGVDHGAVGQHQRHRAHRPVGVGDDAAAHPARVVGDHPADAGDVGAGGIGAEAPAVAGQQAVGVAEDDAGLDASRAPSSSIRTRRQWRRTSTRIESVWLWPLRLVPPARKMTGAPSSVAAAQQLADVLDVAGDGHRLGDQAVGAGVRGVADQVERPGEDPVGAERGDQSGAQRLGRARRDPVGRPVGRRAGRLGDDRGRIDRGGGHYSSHIPEATGTWTSRGPSPAAIDLAQRLGQLLAPGLTSWAGTP